MTDPTADVAGNVTATLEALMPYPLLTAAAVAVVITVQVSPAPTAAIDIDPGPFVIITPLPEVIVAATGSAEVLPIANCPFVNAILFIPLFAAPINISCVVVVVELNVPAPSYFISPVLLQFIELFVGI
jgi:hypothetical protein